MYVVANYKMNGDKKFFVSQVKKLNTLKIKDTNIILCPPFIYLPFLKINKNLSLGSQDLANVVSGRSTGQISANMLKEFQVKYSIIGHSERRANGETDLQIVEKVKCALDAGITPIVCVGEMDKKSDINEILIQVDAVLKDVDKDIIFAYEPVWAIGSGDIPSATKVKRVVKAIKSQGKNKGLNLKVLYGGSVNETNYFSFLISQIDGFLLGGVSLKTDKLIQIIKGIDNE